MFERSESVAFLEDEQEKWGHASDITEQLCNLNERLVNVEGDLMHGWGQQIVEGLNEMNERISFLRPMVLWGNYFAWMSVYPTWKWVIVVKGKRVA